MSMGQFHSDRNVFGRPLSQAPQTIVTDGETEFQIRSWRNNFSRLNREANCETNIINHSGTGLGVHYPYGGGVIPGDIDGCNNLPCSGSKDKRTKGHNNNAHLLDGVKPEDGPDIGILMSAHEFDTKLYFGDAKILCMSCSNWGDWFKKQQHPKAGPIMAAVYLARLMSQDDITGPSGWREADRRALHQTQRMDFPTETDDLVMVRPSQQHHEDRIIRTVSNESQGEAQWMDDLLTLRTEKSTFKTRMVGGGGFPFEKVRDHTYKNPFAAEVNNPVKRKTKMLMEDYMANRGGLGKCPQTADTDGNPTGKRYRKSKFSMNANLSSPTGSNIGSSVGSKASMASTFGSSQMRFYNDLESVDLEQSSVDNGGALEQIVEEKSGFDIVEKGTPHSGTSNKIIENVVSNEQKTSVADRYGTFTKRLIQDRTSLKIKPGAREPRKGNEDADENPAAAADEKAAVDESNCGKPKFDPPKRPVKRKVKGRRPRKKTNKPRTNWDFLFDFSDSDLELDFSATADLILAVREEERQQVVLGKSSSTTGDTGSSRQEQLEEPNLFDDFVKYRTVGNKNVAKMGTGEKKSERNVSFGKEAHPRAGSRHPSADSQHPRANSPFLFMETEEAILSSGGPKESIVRSRQSLDPRQASQIFVKPSIATNDFVVNRITTEKMDGAAETASLYKQVDGAETPVVSNVRPTDLKKAARILEMLQGNKTPQISPASSALTSIISSASKWKDLAKQRMSKFQKKRAEDAEKRGDGKTKVEDFSHLYSSEEKEIVLTLGGECIFERFDELDEMKAEMEEAVHSKAEAKEVAAEEGAEYPSSAGKSRKTFLKVSAMQSFISSMAEPVTEIDLDDKIIREIRKNRNAKANIGRKENAKLVGDGNGKISVAAAMHYGNATSTVGGVVENVANFGDMIEIAEARQMIADMKSGGKRAGKHPGKAAVAPGFGDIKSLKKTLTDETKLAHTTAVLEAEETLRRLEEDAEIRKLKDLGNFDKTAVQMRGNFTEEELDHLADECDFEQGMTIFDTAHDGLDSSSEEEERPNQGVFDAHITKSRLMRIDPQYLPYYSHIFDRRPSLERTIMRYIQPILPMDFLERGLDITQLAAMLGAIEDIVYMYDQPRSWECFVEEKYGGPSAIDGYRIRGNNTNLYSNLVKDETERNFNNELQEYVIGGENRAFADPHTAAFKSKGNRGWEELMKDREAWCRTTGYHAEYFSEPYKFFNAAANANLKGDKLGGGPEFARQTQYCLGLARDKIHNCPSPKWSALAMQEIRPNVLVGPCLIDEARLLRDMFRRYKHLLFTQAVGDDGWCAVYYNSQRHKLYDRMCEVSEAMRRLTDGTGSLRERQWQPGELMEIYTQARMQEYLLKKNGSLIHGSTATERMILNAGLVHNNNAIDLSREDDRKLALCEWLESMYKSYLSIRRQGTRNFVDSSRGRRVGYAKRLYAFVRGKTQLSAAQVRKLMLLMNGEEINELTGFLWEGAHDHSCNARILNHDVDARHEAGGTVPEDRILHRKKMVALAVDRRAKQIFEDATTMDIDYQDCDAERSKRKLRRFKDKFGIRRGDNLWGIHEEDPTIPQGQPIYRLRKTRRRAIVVHGDWFFPDTKLLKQVEVEEGGLRGGGGLGLFKTDAATTAKIEANPNAMVKFSESVHVLRFDPEEPIPTPENEPEQLKKRSSDWETETGIYQNGGQVTEQIHEEPSWASNFEAAVLPGGASERYSRSSSTSNVSDPTGTTADPRGTAPDPRATIAADWSRPETDGESSNADPPQMHPGWKKHGIEGDLFWDAARNEFVKEDGKSAILGGKSVDGESTAGMSFLEELLETRSHGPDTEERFWERAAERLAEGKEGGIHMHESMRLEKDKIGESDEGGEVKDYGDQSGHELSPDGDLSPAQLAKQRQDHYENPRYAERGYEGEVSDKFLGYDRWGTGIWDKPSLRSVNIIRPSGVGNGSQNSPEYFEHVPHHDMHHNAFVVEGDDGDINISGDASPNGDADYYEQRKNQYLQQMAALMGEEQTPEELFAQAIDAGYTEQQASEYAEMQSLGYVQRSTDGESDFRVTENQVRRQAFEQALANGYDESEASQIAEAEAQAYLEKNSNMMQFYPEVESSKVSEIGGTPRVLDNSESNSVPLGFPHGTSLNLFKNTGSTVNRRMARRSIAVQRAREFLRESNPFRDSKTIVENPKGLNDGIADAQKQSGKLSGNILIDKPLGARYQRNVSESRLSDTPIFEAQGEAPLNVIVNSTLSEVAGPRGIDCNRSSQRDRGRESLQRKPSILKNSQKPLRISEITVERINDFEEFHGKGSSLWKKPFKSPRYVTPDADENVPLYSPEPRISKQGVVPPTREGQSTKQESETLADKRESKTKPNGVNNSKTEKKPAGKAWRVSVNSFMSTKIIEEEKQKRAEIRQKKKRNGASARQGSKELFYPEPDLGAVLGGSQTLGKGGLQSAGKNNGNNDGNNTATGTNGHSKKEIAAVNAMLDGIDGVKKEVKRTPKPPRPPEMTDVEKLAGDIKKYEFPTKKTGGALDRIKSAVHGMLHDKEGPASGVAMALDPVAALSATVHKVIKNHSLAPSMCAGHTVPKYLLEQKQVKGNHVNPSVAREAQLAAEAYILKSSRRDKLLPSVVPGEKECLLNMQPVDRYATEKLSALLIHQVENFGGCIVSYHQELLGQSGGSPNFAVVIGVAHVTRRATYLMEGESHTGIGGRTAHYLHSKYALRNHCHEIMRLENSHTDAGIILANPRGSKKKGRQISCIEMQYDKHVRDSRKAHEVANEDLAGKATAQKNHFLQQAIPYEQDFHAQQRMHDKVVAKLFQNETVAGSRTIPEVNSGRFAITTDSLGIGPHTFGKYDGYQTSALMKMPGPKDLKNIHSEVAASGSTGSGQLQIPFQKEIYLGHRPYIQKAVYADCATHAYSKGRAFVDVPNYSLQHQFNKRDALSAVKRMYNNNLDPHFEMPKPLAKFHKHVAGETKGVKLIKQFNSSAKYLHKSHHNVGFQMGYTREVLDGFTRATNANTEPGILALKSKSGKKPRSSSQPPEKTKSAGQPGRSTGSGDPDAGGKAEHHKHDHARRHHHHKEIHHHHYQHHDSDEEKPKKRYHFPNGCKNPSPAEIRRQYLLEKPPPKHDKPYKSAVNDQMKHGAKLWENTGEVLKPTLTTTEKTQKLDPTHPLNTIGEAAQVMLRDVHDDKKKDFKSVKRFAVGGKILSVPDANEDKNEIKKGDSELRDKTKKQLEEFYKLGGNVFNLEYEKGHYQSPKVATTLVDGVPTVIDGNDHGNIPGGSKDKHGKSKKEKPKVDLKHEDAHKFVSKLGEKDDHHEHSSTCNYQVNREDEKNERPKGKSSANSTHENKEIKVNPIYQDGHITTEVEDIEPWALLLDPWPQTPVIWVPIRRLAHAMNTVDADGKIRGLIMVQHESSIGFGNMSRKPKIWRQR